MPNNPPSISAKAVRINSGMSQKEAAKAIGISVSTLQNYESGKTVPCWDVVNKMAATYRYPSDYIFFNRNYT